MNKRLLSTIFTFLVFIPTLSHAIGLGGLKTNSRLNEPFDAEIPILSASKSEYSKLTISFAPNSVFEKYNVQRRDILGKIKLKIVDKNNRLYVKLSSKQQITVPYLNFVLQLGTPNGVITREYASFLDPRSSASSSATKSTTLVTKNNKKTGSSNNRSPKRNNPTKSSSYEVTASGKKYGPVKKNQTLWSIANYTKPSKSFPTREMVSIIMNANPNVFPKKNSSSLYEGAFLTIPTIKGYPAFSGGSAPLPGTQVAIKKKR